MKKSFIFLIGMCFCLQFTKVQAQGDPFKCHYWQKEHSVNYTLSYPIVDADSTLKWLQAVAKHDVDGHGNFKNTIAVLKLDNYYNIPWGIEPKVFGKSNGGEEYDPYVNFEVHSIVQSCNPDTTYILCGSMGDEESGQTATGMVAVLNTNLDVISLREYPDTKVFYSVYAQGENFYVCGETVNNSGIIMQDNIITPGLNRMAYVDLNWVFHKIRAKGAPCEYNEINISGIYTDNIGQFIGYTTYKLYPTNFSYVDQIQVSLTFSPPLPPPPIPSTIVPNSRVTISNYPGHKDGLILSISDDKHIYMFMFDRSASPLITTYGFIISDWEGVLEDMDCAGYVSSGQQYYRIAWVGNKKNPDEKPPLVADYLVADLANPSFPPRFPSNFANIISFKPSNADETAYYSLHKIHFYGTHNLSGDNRFHTGGYYSGRDETFNPNIATFAVTPEDVIDKVTCASRWERRILSFNFPPYRCYQAVEITPLVNVIPTYSQTFGFCTKSCADDLCGYPKEENTKGNAKSFKKGKKNNLKN